MNNEYDPKKLTDEIRTLCLENGADLVGFVNSEILEKYAPRKHRPSVLMQNSKSVIVIACGRKLNEDRDYQYEWGPGFAKTTIQLKKHIPPIRMEARKSVEAVKNHLNNLGFPVITESHGWSGVLSFKRAAHQSGLGVFGKGEFVVHPKFGPLNVLCCMVTNALFEYSSPLDIDVCGDCIECIKACKYGAFKKKDDKFDWIPEKCRCYDLIMNPVTEKWTYGPCNSKCANACPIGL